MASGDALRMRLRSAFAWRGDRTDEHYYADLTGWWHDGELLAALGPALADLFPAEPAATIILGPESRGSLLGPLVATHLRVGYVEVRKNRTAACDSDRWVRQTTPPDYRDRHLELGFRRALLRSSDRVLAVDDWIETGSQALAVRGMVNSVGATWIGIACIVDALHDARLRRELNVHALLSSRDL